MEFPQRGTLLEIEEGACFMPLFDATGLISCVTQNCQTHKVLMLGWMNREALARTMKTGLAHYYSRTRRTLWKKGEQSEQRQIVKRILIDDDQDCLLIEMELTGGASCHGQATVRVFSVHWNGSRAKRIFLSVFWKRKESTTRKSLMEALTMNELIPVTVLTGFLGAGKTTLLNRILSENHGRKIAVIENEFGEVGIDNDLLVESAEQVVVMNNGCICCTVRGDLVRILGEIGEQRAVGKIDFEHVIIETTGLADPAPVTQTFFVDDTVRETYRLDAVVTIVDAKHAMRQLDANHEAQEQVGFADRILVSKTDLVGEGDYNRLLERLRGMNRRATIQRAHPGQTDLAELLNVRGFNLDDILEIEPDFLADVNHEHDDEVKSFVIRETRPYDSDRLNTAMDVLATTLGNELLRYKGILNLVDNPHKIVFQGVHMIMGGTELRPWREDETRENVMVFIGRNLPENSIRRIFETCVVDSAA